MLRLIVSIVLALTLGCGEAEIEAPEVIVESSIVETPTMSTEDAGFLRDEAWVCHHPGTKMHNKECIEEPYPEGCYVRGNSTVFCWLLMRPECESPHKYPEVQNVCHILK